MASITYRSFRPSDFDDLHTVVSDWSVVRQLGGWPWPPDPGFTRNRSKPYDGDGFVWAICLDDRVIGMIGVTNGDLGYALDAAQHGKGIMSKAAKHAVGHAFATTDRDHLTGSTWYDNPASYKLLQRLGYRHWQSTYIRSKARGLPVMVYHQRLTRETWDRLSTAAQ